MSGGDVRVLLAHHLKNLRLPVFLREYEKVGQQCARENVDYSRFLQQLSELELIEREKRGTERRVKEAGFPVRKTLDTFQFTALPSLNKQLVCELARCEYISRYENVLAVGNSGTGKTHIATALGIAACYEGFRVKFYTAAHLVTTLMEARDERSLGRLKKQFSRQHLVIVDELGYVPFSKTGAELLFEFFAERYERGSVLVTTNLPFDQWTEVLGSERLTGALLDRLTHRVHILEMNGESYRFKESLRRHGKKIKNVSEQRKEENEKKMKNSSQGE
jgi:DNA replication protein DnaC